ncbi:uncharacterized protein BP5553_03177 [Venustampulla echinocandica]|uniref:Uncharacterized protein n=1 Tax=Venustampulla echinocandica TaxID=2656787 RepID=A0A370TTI3_9HELO|nr:uncharacterized protein BP5553_03177 [Venustampulla echinocandica]RDL38837.1 hypothetical protein BP5553_03177 [Venustampulla echinocandica]
MKTLSGYLDDAYSAWLGAALGCCSPQRKQTLRRGHGHEVEKPMRIEHYQPRLIPSPVSEPQERPTTRGREWRERSRSFASRASSRGSFSVRRKLNAYNGPRRPRISAPSDFRVVEHALPKIQRRSREFRPLELSIYMPQRQLSPILPHFGTMDDVTHPDNMNDLTYPPSTFCHSRSESALSFSIPRKAVRSGSRTSSDWTAQFQPRPESINTQELLAKLENDMPKRPAQARLRAMTEPPTYERIKSALHEKFELEQRLRDIDEVIEERKSIYFNSRPTSRATSRPRSIYSESQEPMPSPPAMKPSFATRVASPAYNQRPQTAPSKAIHIPSRLKSFTEASSTFTPEVPPPPPPKSPLRSLPQSPQDTILPPPLPLVLQAPHPPLRKKKSFSRVSNWLSRSTAAEAPHSRNLSLDSVTNTPKPVTSREGFYQCVDVANQGSYGYGYDARRNSVGSVSTVSTLESDVDDDDDEDESAKQSATITPESSPGRVKGRGFEPQREIEKSIELERTRTFGEKQMRADEKWRMETPIETGLHIPGRNSVGVAF